MARKRGDKFAAMCERYEIVFPGDRVSSSYPVGPNTSRHVFRSSDGALFPIVGETQAIRYMGDRINASTPVDIEYLTPQGWTTDRRFETAPRIRARTDDTLVVEIGPDPGVQAVLGTSLKYLVASDLVEVQTLPSEPVATIDEALAWIYQNTGYLYGRRES